MQYGNGLYGASLYGDSGGSGGIPLTGTLNLVVASAPPVWGTIPLFAAGSTTVARSSLPLYAGGQQDAIVGVLNLATVGSVFGSLEASLNLATRGGHSPLSGSIPLYAASRPPIDNSLLLFAAGDGLYPGFVPTSNTLNLALRRDAREGGIPLFACNKGVENTLALWADGQPWAEGTLLLTASPGAGGNPVATLTLAVPSAVDWTAADATLPLVIPGSVGWKAATLTLYTHGRSA